MKRNPIQTALQLVYPPRCVSCGELVDDDFGLCGPCWRDTPIISGLCCDLCGVPLPGGTEDEIAKCDACLKITRPWSKGRSVLVYRDNARKLVLALKHGDRHDIVHLARPWMARIAKALVAPHTIIAPVPLHWTRLLKRRYNQSALLAQNLACSVSCSYCPDLLVRKKHTASLEGMGYDARFQTLDGAISVHPRRKALLHQRQVLLVDDVMTSGATLSACAQTCLASGAKDVRVLALARVAKDT